MTIHDLLFYHLSIFCILGFLYTYENWSEPSAWEWEELLYPLSGLIPLVGELVLVLCVWDYLVFGYRKLTGK